MNLSNVNAYPYLSMVIKFAALESLIGGLIAQLSLMIISREANFAQIGFQPLVYVGLFGIIPALFTGTVVASKRLRYEHKKSLRSTFLVAFVALALYIGAIVIYLGINSGREVAVLLTFMLIVGLFGGINATIASLIALPKSRKSYFDKESKNNQDIYQSNCL